MGGNAVTVLRKLHNDRAYYMEKCLKIRTKEGKLAPFRLNEEQKKLNEVIVKIQLEGKPVRIIILKARQMGISTFTEGVIFHRVATKKMSKALIVAHEEQASTNLFNMSKLYYEELPSAIRPMRKASNSTELVFENPSQDPDIKKKKPGLRSSIKIASAKNVKTGRSDTIHLLHASEVGFWPDANTLMTGLMQQVPETPESMVFLESTANGVGGYFYDMWMRAKRGESDFYPLFLPWFDHDEYSKPFLSPQEEQVLIDSLDEEEKGLRSQFNLSYEQLNWRRSIIANKMNGDIDAFHQEYPSTDIEAFLVSGRPVFNINALRAMLAEATPPKWRGYLLEKEGRVQFIEDPKGYLSIWKKPEDGRDYLISADIAQGLAIGDYSVADVFDRRSLEQVCQWHGKIDPDLFGKELQKLGKWYQLAFIVPEANNHGLTTVTSLKKVYGRIYRRRTIDKITDKPREEYGWLTTTKTKPLAIDKAAEMIRERFVKINCKETVEELLTYVRDDKGATNAQDGCFDDRVMSLAIGMYANYEVPFFDVINEDPEYIPAFGRTGY